MNPGDTRSRYRIERIKKALKEGDLDQWQLADKIVIDRRYMREYVKYCIAAELAHVIGWTRYSTNGPPIPILRAGQGENVPKPDAIPYKDRKAKRYAELKKDPERHEAHLRRQRELRRKPPKPDDLLGWVFKPKGEVDGNE